MSADAELLRRYVQQGSQAAFAELVHRHFKLVYSAALRRSGNSSERAAEIAQRVFISLSRNAHRLLGHPVLAGWLYTATRNAAIDLVRAEKRHQTREQESFTMQQLDAASERRVKWEEIRAELDMVIDNLNDRDRQAIVLRFFEGLSYPEIAIQLRSGADAARMRVERALEKLRALLERRGVTSTSSAALALALTQNGISAPPAGLMATVTGGALAVAPVSSVLTALNLMCTTKLTVLVGSVVVALTLAVTGYEIRLLRRDEAALAAANQQYVLGGRSFANLEREAKDRAEQIRRSRAAAAASNQSTRRKRVQKSFVDQFVEQQLANGRELESRHPEVKDLMAKLSRASIHTRYHQLYAALNLSPAQIERFESLIAKSGIRSYGTMLAFGVNPERVNRQELAQQLHASLGEVGYKELSNYPLIESSLNLADQIAIDSAAASTPLSPKQIAALAGVLSQNPPNFPQSKSEAAAVLNRGTTATQVAALLDPQQWATFSAIRQQIQANAAVTAAGLSTANAVP